METGHTRLCALLILPLLASFSSVSLAATRSAAIESSATRTGATQTAATGPTAGAVVLHARAEVETVQENPDGTRSVRRVPAETVVPGDEVIYTLVYDNQGAAPADEVFITNPIPEHMELRRADAGPAWLETLYSVDGGLVFGPLSDLTVTDSAGLSRRATPQDCTHIRWQFHRSLAPGETGQVSYTTRLL